MKVLFIIPPDIHYIEPYVYIKADKNNVQRPPMGLLYVAGELRKNLGITPKIVDACNDGLNLKAIEGLVLEEKPDIVGFSVLTFNLLNCMEVCKIIREVSPKTKICFGGWHPTLYPEETLDLGLADFIVIGEGEITFTELIKTLMGNDSGLEKSLEEINGIGYKTKEGLIKINPPAKLVKNLDDFGFPAYDLIDNSKYTNLLATTGDIFHIITSRGCPHKCIFCDIRQTPYRVRSALNIIKEIELWYEKGTREFYIQDDNFTINKKNAIEFCNLLLERNLKIKYKISSRIDSLDDELIKKLKESGCYRIHFGVESGSQGILDYLQKGIKVEDIKKAFELAKKHKIARFAYIMIGAPSENNKDISQTLKLIKEIKPEYLHCSICTPMPKTYLYQKMIKDDLIKEDYWLNFAKKPDPLFKTPFASRLFKNDELRGMQEKIQKQFYFNPCFIIKEITKTKGIKPFITKAKLAFKMIFS